MFDIHESKQANKILIFLCCECLYESVRNYIICVNLFNINNIVLYTLS